MTKAIFICLTVLILATGCVKDMDTYELGSPNAARKVLVAGTGSEFKQKVISEVIARLGTENYYFKIVGLKQLEKEPLDGYRAIVLVSTMMAGQIDKRIVRFMKDNPAAPKTVVFFTRGSDNPLPDKAKTKLPVDTISAASKASNLDSLANQLVTRIEQKF